MVDGEFTGARAFSAVLAAVLVPSKEVSAGERRLGARHAIEVGQHNDLGHTDFEGHRSHAWLIGFHRQIRPGLKGVHLVCLWLYSASRASEYHSQCLAHRGSGDGGPGLVQDQGLVIQDTDVGFH